MARTRAAQVPSRSRALLDNSTRFAYHLEHLAVCLLADAQDPMEEYAALAMAQLAGKARRGLRSGKYGQRGRYDRVKSEDFFEIILALAPVRWFKSWLRMDRSAFWHLHSLIREDPVFVSTGKKPQRPSWLQLAVFLCRMGGKTAITSASFASVSEGAVFLYTDRVCQALRNIRKDHIYWPNNAEREKFSDTMSKWGFPGCLGSGDGTYVRLEKRPSQNGYAYWCRKKMYAIVIQATVDHRARFTSYDFGWPGSVQDSRVFKSSHLWCNRELYFRSHEYILVDKGYPLTKYSIHPFNDYDLTNNPAEARVRRRFNRRLSSLRIFVEHAFGRLKGRFPILRCMSACDVDEAYRIVEALMVVHNILERFDDDPSDIEDFNDEEDDDVDEVRGQVAAQLPVDEGMDNDTLYATGLYRRKWLLDMMRAEFED